MTIQLDKTLDGPILDLGGGGEGVIGQIYQAQATAIDNRQEELDEAPDGPRKLLMDAGDLAFEDASFQHVTAFYSFMYMEKTSHRAVVQEAFRVLRFGGQFHIWDTAIGSASPDPFMIELDLDANGKPIHTTYGIVKDDACQDSGYFIRLCEAAGFCLSERTEQNGRFYLRFIK